MASRARKPTPAAPSGVGPDLEALLRHLAQLVDEGGQISVGEHYPAGCVAVAKDGHNSLAMLRRRPEEGFGDLLLRLDAALARAWNEDFFTDEINPSTASRRR